MKRNKVVVKILGQEYTLVSEEPKEYMQKISNYVDDKMEEIAAKNKKLSTAMIAVLTSLNIADEYHKLYDATKAIKEEREKPLFELEEVRKQLDSTKNELNNLKEEYNKVLLENERFEKESVKLIEEIAKLKEEINRLNHELNLKENKLKKAERINEDLKGKLLQNEIKLIQTKKELEGYIELFDNLTSK